ncbi:MAG TPA: LysR family transcriptional regulator [Candidatus Limnocylindrales bacterium]|nr:LysR family transcriptional regulator [Candidatus Limnocylindrales bacterium]
MRTIDLNQVRLFVRVVDAGSFTAAARAVGLPKSSVSRAVSALERELGIRLIQRTTRRVQATDAGRTYYETVSRALSGIDDASEAVAELKDVPRGTVRITAPADSGHTLLADTVVRFAQSYPEVRIDVSLTQRVVEMVHEGFDLAIRIGKLADSGLVARRMGFVHAGLFASKTYLERKPRPRSIADLAEHECILFRSAGPTVWELVGPSGPESVEVHGALSADDHHMVRDAAAEGQGIALLPIFMCSGQTGDSDLVRVLPMHTTAGVPIHLIHPSAHFIPKRVTLLRDQLLEDIPRLLRV